MVHRAPCLVLVGLALVAACTDATPFGPASAGITGLRTAAASDRARRIVAMTRNLYIGADVDAVIGALATPDPGDDLAALNRAIATLQRTAYPLRAEALADEIASHRPHVVGLQEVEELSINLAAIGGPVIDLDFLAILRAALAARGLNYATAADVANTTVTLPLGPGATISLVDHDAILVDAARVSVGPTVVEQNFATNLGGVVPGVVNLIRGWVAIRAIIEGAPVTVTNTHLEAGNAPIVQTVRAAQAAELMASLVASSPVILLGDLNDEPGSVMYQVVTEADFVDTWGAMRPGAAGLTCCHANDLSNAVATGEFDQRIDYVLARGFASRNGRLLGKVTIIGTAPGDRVAGPEYRLWPSDHAGVVAELLLPNTP